jgi:hypothetical protein
VDSTVFRCAFNRLITTPIKHIYRKNQRIFRAKLANQLILLMPKFRIIDDARKIWCGKNLILFKIMLDFYDNYANKTW